MPTAADPRGRLEVIVVLQFEASRAFEVPGHLELGSPEFDEWCHGRCDELNRDPQWFRRQEFAIDGAGNNVYRNGV